MKSVFALLAVLVLLGAPAWAVSPGEALSDPALESRARAISAELRCLVCQNQSIDDSEAELARDLRVLVRERIVAGDSNEAVLRYVVDRYGEFVLLRPVMAPHTLVLWLAAPVLLAVGLLALLMSGRRRRLGAPAALTQEEREALEALREQ